MKDSDKKLFSRFKRNLEAIKTEGVAVEDDYVMIKRSTWDDSQRRYNYLMNLQKSIYGKVN